MNNVITDKNIEAIKEKVKNIKSQEMELDLSSMNIIDASKAAVLSSAIYYSRNPEGKIKCKLRSESVKNFIAGFDVKNLEFIL